MKPRRPVSIGIIFTNKIEDVNPILVEYGKVSLFKSVQLIDKDETMGDVEMQNAMDEPNATPVSKNGTLTHGDLEVGPSTPQTVPEEGNFLSHRCYVDILRE